MFDKTLKEREIEFEGFKLKAEERTGQPTLIEIMTKLNRLELENGWLKADNQELTKEKDQWKEGFMLLHNRMKELNIDYTLPQTEDGEIGDMSYVEEYAKGNAEWDNLRLPKELEWKYED